MLLSLAVLNNMECALSLGSLLASVDTIYLILNCCILSISLDPFYDISL